MDNMKKFLTPVILDSTPNWVDIGAPIKKKDLKIDARFLFGFINISIMSSLNDLIRPSPR